MQHVDEGTIHAFLDGELSPAEATEFERHLSVCSPCRAKLAEERGFFSESQGLIVALDNVAPSTRPATTAIAFKRPRPWFVRPAALAWAASIVFAAGIGYSWRGTPEAQPFASGVAEIAAIIPEEQDAAKTAASPAPAALNSAAPTSTRQATAGRRADVASSPSTPPATQLSSGEQTLGAAGAASGKSNGVEPREGSPAPIPAAHDAAPAAAAAPSYAYQQGVPVDTTAAAIAGRVAFGPATTAEPKRITLDEAVTLLGGSIQLIDGLTPQRVELLAGLDVAGADPNRQVVRIYYEEPDLGLVTLDQQRPGPSFDAMRRAESEPPQVTMNYAAPSAARTRTAMAGGPPPATTIWRTEGVWLALTTRLPADRMAALQARVR